MLLVLIYFFLLIWSNCCDLCELITATTFFAFTWSIKLLFLSISLLTIWGQAFIPPISQKHGPLKCSTYNMRKLFFISSSMFALNHSHPCGLNVDICIDKLLSHNKKPPKSHIFLNLHFWISVKVTMMLNKTPTWCNKMQILLLQTFSTCFGRQAPVIGSIKYWHGSHRYR